MARRAAMRPDTMLETEFDRRLLEGFAGFMPVAELLGLIDRDLLGSRVPEVVGVYSVVLPKLSSVVFMTTSQAGKTKGDPGN